MTGAVAADAVTGAVGGVAAATGSTRFFFFFGGTTATFLSSTTTGFGASRGVSDPATASGRMETVCGWKSLRVNVLERSLPDFNVNSQGVRQLCPSEVFTSAPGGSDSNRTASVGGEEEPKFKLGMVAEHAASEKPHAKTAMTRLMSKPTYLGGIRPPNPKTTDEREESERRPCSPVPWQQAENSSPSVATIR